MLSEENMSQYGEAFGSRIDAGEGSCAHAVFPEVSENEHTAEIVSACLSRVAEVYMESGDLERTTKTIEHALIVSMAFGMGYGALDSLPSRDDSGDYSWGLSDEQLSELSEGDFLGD